MKYEEFLAAINAAPNDKAPRLIFADWLDENDCPEEAAALRLEANTPSPEVPEDDYRWGSDIKVEHLTGKILKEVRRRDGSGRRGGDEILFVVNDGEEYLMLHDQD